MLGYYPPPPTSRRPRLKALAGDPWARFRSLEIRTTRPGVTIRARKGYWQDDTRLDQRAPVAAGSVTVQAVTNVLPESALPLRALAVPFRGDPKAKTHPVAVAIEVTASPRDGGPERAELVAVAVAPGKPLRAMQRATATFGSGARRAAISRYLLCERLDLKPGRYQLRLGVTSSWAQATGSVYVGVTVPDYGKEVLSMSGLVLDQRSSSAQIPAARTNVITALVAVPPSLARAFAPGDTVWAHVEIYRGPKSPGGAVEVAATLGHEREDEPAWHVRESFPPSAFETTNRVVYRVPLPIGSLAPGAYRLRITATTGASADNPFIVRREMDIAIVGGPATSGSSGTARQATHGIGPLSIR
jgi:hypothetical protein